MRDALLSVSRGDQALRAMAKHDFQIASRGHDSMVGA